jgi:hypothetical protein
MLFLILAPYAALTGLMLLTSAAASLSAAAAICLLAIGRDIWGGKSVKMLSAGSAILFVAIACYITWVDVGFNSSEVKLTVDAGMLAISLVSLAIHRPFTLQYAQERVDAETARLPEFLRANYVITWAWCLAFVLMMSANVLLIYLPGLPFWSGVTIAFAARSCALYFTKWYPERLRSKMTLPSTV